MVFKISPNKLTLYVAATSQLKTREYQFVLGAGQYRTFRRQPEKGPHRALFRIGAPGEIRTPDPLVRSQVLYPAELRARTKRAMIRYIPEPF